MIINGRKLAAAREALLRNKVSRFIKLNRRKPSLLAIELSADPGSKLYLKLKKAAAERIGVDFHSEKYQILLTSKTDGIFIQHPPGFDKKKWQQLVDQIPPEKDVDCLTSANLELIKQGKPRFLPATVKAVGYCLLEVTQVAKVTHVTQVNHDCFFACATSATCATCVTFRAFLKGKLIVILGRSPILGLPLYRWLKSLGAKVTLLNSKSAVNYSLLTVRSADVLVSAVGSPAIITGDMVKPGVIAIDCGSPRGDLDFDSVSPKAAAITPVPGGVGPLTVVSLMENVFQASTKNRHPERSRWI